MLSISEKYLEKTSSFQAKLKTQSINHSWIGFKTKKSEYLPTYNTLDQKKLNFFCAPKKKIEFETEVSLLIMLNEFISKTR